MKTQRMRSPRMTTQATSKRVQEIRSITFDDWEAREDSGALKLTGYASVFNREANIGGYFIEKVSRGAFKKTIKEGDIRALWNHDPSIVLGRNKAGTLTLSEDDKGLLSDITLPDTQWGRDAWTSVKRGDVSQMSILFAAIRAEWTYPKTNNREDLPKRDIKEARLFEVSPVTFPAFEDTSVSARSLFPHSERIADDLDLLERANQIMACIRLGMPIESDARSVLEQVRSILGSAMPSDAPSDHPSNEGEGVPNIVHIRHAHRKRILDLIK